MHIAVPAISSGRQLYVMGHLSTLHRLLLLFRLGKLRIPRSTQALRRLIMFSGIDIASV